MAVQSHWFSVGPIVPWARAGVGAVATQANVEVAYGPRALDLLSEGRSAAEALEQLVAADPYGDTRQVAVVDAAGTVAAHTGEHCMRWAGHVAGEGVCCQANIMDSPAVWPAMLDAYQSAGGLLAHRLMAALHAAEGAGGDLRGRQSAAILVVPALGESWEAVLSLRVEDHPEPLDELERLLILDEAYTLAGRGDERTAAGEFDAAASLYTRAAELAPASDELTFWSGLGTAQQGDVDKGVALVRSAVAVNAGWKELLSRLTPEQAPAAAAVLAALEGTV